MICKQKMELTTPQWQLSGGWMFVHRKYSEMKFERMLLALYMFIVSFFFGSGISIQGTHPFKGKAEKSRDQINTQEIVAERCDCFA